MKHDVEVTSGAICNTHELKRSPSQGVFDMSFQARQLDMLRQVETDLPKLGNVRSAPLGFSAQLQRQRANV